MGGLDPQLGVAFNDVDFCLRLREAGYRNIWTPFAELYHHESATRGYETSPEKMSRFNGEVVYMRNRYYDPRSRRFISEDPIGLAGGINVYGFADGGPGQLF